MPDFTPRAAAPKACLICNLPMANPTRTQKVHQTGPCKAQFDKMQYERDKEKARVRYENRKRRAAGQ